MVKSININMMNAFARIRDEEPCLQQPSSTMRIAKRTWMKKAIVAVSRKRATILLAMWKSGTAYWATGRPPTSAQDFATA